MRYYALYNEGAMIAIGIGYGGTEITKDEYHSILNDIREKRMLVDQLYSGEITIDAVPAAWQEEIQRRVDERKEREAETAETAEATDEDYLAALAELGVTV